MTDPTAPPPPSGPGGPGGYGNDPYGNQGYGGAPGPGGPGVPPPPAPPYGGGGGQPGGDTSGNVLNILSLVAGIVSVVACCLYGFGILTGVAAIILSIQGKKKAEAGQANNPTLGKVGLILGIIGAALSAIYLILIIVGLSVNPSTFSSTS